MHINYDIEGVGAELRFWYHIFSSDICAKNNRLKIGSAPQLLRLYAQGLETFGERKVRSAIKARYV